MNFTNVVYFILLSNLILISSNSLFDFSSFSSGRHLYKIKSKNLKENGTKIESKSNKTFVQNETISNRVLNKTNEETKSQKRKKEIESINKIPAIALVSFFSEELNKTILDSSLIYWLKSGGARLVIIDQNFPEAKLEKLFDYVNSFLIMDYHMLDEEISSYFTFVSKLTNRLIEINYPANNEQKLKYKFLPLFGIGSGANYIQAAIANSTEIIKPYIKVQNTNKIVELVGPLKRIRSISHFDKRDYYNFVKKTSSFYSSNNFVDYEFYLKNIKL